MTRDTLIQAFEMTKLDNVKTLLPGFFIAVMVAIAATFLSEHHGGPVMLYALLLGTAFHFLSEDQKCAAGIQFSAKKNLTGRRGSIGGPYHNRSSR